MEDLWQAVLVLFQQWTGMILPSTMRGRVLDTVRRQAREAERPPLLFLRALSRDAPLRQRLLDDIGLGTTWFMRDEAGLRAMVDALARVTPAGQSVCVWSAGCASGEEPYSLAMALTEAGMNARILATDLNRRALRLAFEGRYRAHAVDRLSPAWRVRYFADAGPGMKRVSDAIRQQVTFELHNFRTSDDLPAGWHRFDAVVCRNVLIYFDRAEAVRIIDRLARRCRPGGYLLLGAVERPLFWMREMAASSDAAELVQVRSDTQPSATPQPRRVSASVPAVQPRAEQSVEDAAAIDDLLVQAEAAEQGGRIGEALAMTHKAVTRAPLSAPAHLARGLALKRAGRLHDAIEAFRVARFLDDHAWLAPFQLALCLESMGEMEEAYEAYRHALGVLDAQGPTGLGKISIAVENLATTVAEVCRNRVQTGSGLRT